MPFARVTFDDASPLMSGLDAGSAALIQAASQLPGLRMQQQRLDMDQQEQGLRLQEHQQRMGFEAHQHQLAPLMMTPAGEITDEQLAGLSPEEAAAFGGRREAAFRSEAVDALNRAPLAMRQESIGVRNSAVANGASGGVSGNTRLVSSRHIDDRELMMHQELLKGKLSSYDKSIEAARKDMNPAEAKRLQGERDQVERQGMTTFQGLLAQQRDALDQQTQAQQGAAAMQMSQSGHGLDPFDLAKREELVQEYIAQRKAGKKANWTRYHELMGQEAAKPAPIPDAGVGAGAAPGMDLAPAADVAPLAMSHGNATPDPSQAALGPHPDIAPALESAKAAMAAAQAKVQGGTATPEDYALMNRLSDALSRAPAHIQAAAGAPRQVFQPAPQTARAGVPNLPDAITGPPGMRMAAPLASPGAPLMMNEDPALSAWQRSIAGRQARVGDILRRSSQERAAFQPNPLQ